MALEFTRRTERQNLGKPSGLGTSAAWDFDCLNTTLQIPRFVREKRFSDEAMH